MALETKRFIAVGAALLACSVDAGGGAPNNQCDEWTVQWQHLEGAKSGQDGRWLILHHGKVIHTGAPEGDSATPLSPTCQQAVLIDHKAAKIRIYELTRAMTRWPAPSKSLPMPMESSKACELSRMRWLDSEKLSLLAGCHGWHGALPVLINMTNGKLFLDGQAMCRLGAESPDGGCEAKPFEWPQ